MTTVLTLLLKITVGSCLTALAIILVRMLFHRVLSAKAKYYLWLILALRLCLPVLPGSPTSIMNWIPAPGIVLSDSLEAPAARSETSGVSEIAAVPAPEAVPSAHVNPTPVTDIPVASQPEPVHNPISRNTVILLVWLLGVGISLITQTLLYSITGAAFKRLPVCSDDDTIREFHALKRALDFHGAAQLRVGGSGMSGGLLCPVIVIPGDAQGESARPILLHELLHIRSGDLLLLAFYRFLCAIHWYNPVVWLSFWQLKRDCETANDQRVLETGLVTPVDYAATLYAEGIAAMVFGSTHFGGSDHNIKTRISLISRFKKPAIGVTVLATVLALVICACTVTDRYHIVSEPPVAETEALISEDNLYNDYSNYVEPLLPPNAIFGLTFDEHVERGLLDPEAGTLTQHHFSDLDMTYTIFSTTAEMGGFPLTVDYDFAQNALSEDEILTQVFVHLPQSEDFDMEYWLDDISGGWKDTMVQDQRYYEYQWCTKACVGSYLTAEQMEKAAEALVRMGEESNGNTNESYPSTIEEALAALDGNWSVLNYFYTDGNHIWQYNGTGAAMIMAAHKQDTAPATLEEAIRKYAIPYGEFGLTFEENVAAGYLDPDKCELTDGTDLQRNERCTYYLTEIQVGGEATPATYVFSGTQFDEDTPVLTAIYVHIPTSVMDKEAWISEMDGSWQNRMYHAPGIAYYFSQEYAGDFLTDAQKQFIAQRVAEEGYSDSTDTAHSDINNLYLAQYRVVNTDLIFDGTGIALCRSAPQETKDVPAGKAGTVAFYSADDDQISFQNAQWGTSYEEVISDENLDMNEWIYSDSQKPVLSLSNPLPDRPEVASIAYHFDYSAPWLAYVLSNVEIKYDASMLTYEELVAQRTAELGVPKEKDEDKAIWQFGSSWFQVQNGKKTLREWLQSGIINSPLSGLDTAHWDSFYGDIQPPKGEYGLTFEEHLKKGLLREADGTYETKTEILSVFHTELELGGYTLPAEYVFTETLALAGTGKRVLTEVRVDLPEGVARSKWIMSFSSPWRKHMLGATETYQWYTPYTVGMMIDDTQKETLAEQILSRGIVDTMEAAQDYIDQWHLAGARCVEEDSCWQFNGTGLALYRSLMDLS